MRTLVFIAAVLVAACARTGGDGAGTESSGDAAAAVASPTGREFVLHQGESARVGGDGLRLTFLALREDSRCPIDVQCAWAGNARLELVARQPDHDSAHIELNTSLEPRSRPYDGVEVVLVALAPAPRVGVPIQGSEYVATLRVDRR
jgi:hypothetical protein